MTPFERPRVTSSGISLHPCHPLGIRFYPCTISHRISRKHLWLHASPRTHMNFCTRQLLPLSPPQVNLAVTSAISIPDRNL